LREHEAIQRLEEEDAMAHRCTAAAEASGERRVAAKHVKLAEASDRMLGHTRRRRRHALQTLRAQVTQVRLRDTERETERQRDTHS
jgi:hypothetical protein